MLHSDLASAKQIPGDESSSLLVKQLVQAFCFYWEALTRAE